MDTGFWQKGFSADVAATVPGYILGGVASFSVPWCFGTIVGLAALALETTPIWPSYPNAMSPEEVSAGLVLPYVAQAVAGKGGAAAILLTIFMVRHQVLLFQLDADEKQVINIHCVCSNDSHLLHNLLRHLRYLYQQDADGQTTHPMVTYRRCLYIPVYLVSRYGLPSRRRRHDLASLHDWQCHQSRVFPDYACTSLETAD